ncbi:uncharacterized protein LOC113471740 [Diaphorina citri]|uniref:Uncharacterized protein LOC113471740 n=1 Tax=Diaphorina citri TaxID=121845 RepID=A0A3Q0JEN0_DIACI|nr:uncharacterized protein LOC113471740 [Diaphorina citri]
MIDLLEISVFNVLSPLGGETIIKPIHVFQDYKGNFTEENIIDWILNNLSSKPVSWINLSGSKSVTLNYYLKNETSLVLFTPRNLLRNINIYYNILKIIAADFHKNCRSRGSDADKYQILINYLTINNIVETANHKILAQTCDQLKLRIIEKIIKRRKSLEREQEANLSLRTSLKGRTKGFVNETMDKTDGHAFGLNYGTSYVLNLLSNIRDTYMPIISSAL